MFCSFSEFYYFENQNLEKVLIELYPIQTFYFLNREYLKADGISKQKNFIIGYSDLKKAQIYTLSTTRKTKLIDISRLQGILHITADKMTGKHYNLTQSIVDWAANTPELDYDGITYPSRHYLGMCTAFWAKKERLAPLVELSHCSIDTYSDNRKENFPQNWLYDDISGIEIITETLQFDINIDE